MAKENLEARLGFRLPSAVADDWRSQAKASGLSLSDWLRGLVDSRQTTGLPTPASQPRCDEKNSYDPELMRQLLKIGNNLNQVARALNTSKKMGTPFDMIQALVLLNSIEQQISPVLSVLPPAPSLSRSAETVARTKARFAAKRAAKIKAMQAKNAD